MNEVIPSSTFFHIKDTKIDPVLTTPIFVFLAVICLAIYDHPNAFRRVAILQEIDCRL